ncbi:hypothetical protein HDU96_005987 [Phlyctochytrium bullatum]|nr:hypothetical protein HDU96_005987 [Phlyctochytrium bullatum]
MTRASDVTSRLTDTSKYTGSHKERFDANGKGRGVAGRADLVAVDGSTSSATRDHTVDKTPIQQSTKPVVKPKTDAETYGEKPPKVTFFPYGDKNHAGDQMVLTKQKFPSFKQLSEKVTAMQPTGKAKLVLEIGSGDVSGWKEVKSLGDIQDGGMYLVITAYDKSKLDAAKLPQKVRTASGLNLEPWLDACIIPMASKFSAARAAFEPWVARPHSSNPKQV